MNIPLQSSQSGNTIQVYFWLRSEPNILERRSKKVQPRWCHHARKSATSLTRVSVSHCGWLVSSFKSPNCSPWLHLHLSLWRFGAFRPKRGLFFPPGSDGPMACEAPTNPKSPGEWRGTATRLAAESDTVPWGCLSYGRWWHNKAWIVSICIYIMQSEIAFFKHVRSRS